MTALQRRILESGLPTSVKVTCLVMALFGTREGDRIYPSVGRVAGLLGLGRSTVAGHLATLRELGVLVPTSATTGGRGRSVHYRIHDGALPLPARSEPSSGLDSYVADFDCKTLQPAGRNPPADWQKPSSGLEGIR